MSADPYVWFDPFEARERAKWERQYGREEVLDRLGNEMRGPLWKSLLDEVSLMAGEIADLTLRPRIQEDYATAMRHKSLVERRIEALSMQIIRPMFAPSGGDLKIRLSAPFTESEALEIQVEVGTVQPFHYAIHLPPEKQK